MSHRSEDRLDDHVAAAHRAHRCHRVRHALADDRLGRRQPGLLQQRRRVELVDRALDRARRVHHRHAALLDPVQRVHAVDDLLERSARNDAREHGVGVEERHGVAREAGAATPAAQPRPQPFVRQHARRVAALGQRAAQLVGVPAGPRAQDGDVHRQSAPEERRAQHVGFEPTRVERPSARRARQPHFGRAEEHRVDLIEVVVVALEDVVERRAVVGATPTRAAARRARPARRLRRARRSAPDRRRECSRWSGRWRACRSARSAGAAPCPSRSRRACTSKPSVSILCRPVSITRATICTPPARLAVGRDGERQARRRDARLARHPRGDVVASAACGLRAPARRGSASSA